ncbi:MAG: DUF3080 family protein [Gammaproteobacteria bacterium]|nr:DUF3080 family protein [Gammaproteobacteria bacterium]
MSSICRYKLLTLIAVVFSLASCGLFEQESSTIISIKDYQSRIFRLLKIDSGVKEQANHQLSQAFYYPNRRLLKIELTPIKVKWADFFSTIDCPVLQQIISQKNSQLGRSADALNQLVHELSFHEAYANCDLKLERLSDEWQQGILQKQSEFKAIVFNSTWASRYWQKTFFSVNKNNNLEQSNQTALQALASLRIEITKVNQLVKQSVHAGSKQTSTLDIDKVFAAFKELEIRTGTLGGLMNDGIRINDYLKQITEQLTLHANSICPQGVSTKQAEYLFNVLRKFFLKDVQNRVQTNIHNLNELEIELRHWQQLFDIHWPASLDTVFYLNAPNLLSEQLTDSVRQHVDVWQTLGKNCGMSIHDTL